MALCCKSSRYNIIIFPRAAQAVIITLFAKREEVMGRKSKPFVIATEGRTVDGRHVSREWITQMAANYDPAAYCAVVNLEHILALHPESDFSAYGRVVSLSTQEGKILGEKRLQLAAVVEVAEPAIAMQKDGKKCFASMEVIPNFVNGQAYLTGLALTDTPACLGTEPMRFSAWNDEQGKTGENVYSFAGETELSFDEQKTQDESQNKATQEGEGVFAKIKALLAGGPPRAADDARLADYARAIEALADSQKTTVERLGAFEKSAGELKAELAALKAALAATDAGEKTPAAPGGAGVLKTDC
jgi:hypothetical protein